MSNYRIETPLACRDTGSLGLHATNSANSIIITSAATSANVDFTLPATAGTSGQYLQRSGPTSTTWASGTAVATNDTIPATIRLMGGNLPVTPTNITTVAFTVVGYFIFGGTTTSRTPQTMSIVFSVSPANTAGQVRLGDLTTPTANITTTTVTNTTTAVTQASVAINTLLLPANQSVMVLSAAITTATTLSLYSITIR